jgi:hypothetical protein
VSASAFASASFWSFIGAGLLAPSLTNLNHFYLGFNRDNVLLISVNPTVIGYKDVFLSTNKCRNEFERSPGVRTVSY